MYVAECRNYLKDFPGLIPCADSPGVENTTVQCEIKKNGLVIFNETILLENGKEEGVVIDRIIYDYWHGAAIERTLKLPDSTPPQVSGFYVCLNKSHESQFLEFSLTVNQTGIEMPCPVPFALKNHLTRKQFHSVTTIWYHNGEIISKSNSSYKYNQGFQYYTINGATLESTPGNYTCSIEHNGTKLAVKDYTVCVKPEKSSSWSENVEIQSENGTLHIPPGANITLRCSGKENKALFLGAEVSWWKKYANGTRSEICTLSANECKSCEQGACKECCKTQVKKFKQGFCYPPTQKDIDDYGYYLGRYRTELHLRNVSVDDEAVYECVSFQRGDTSSSNVTLSVRKETKYPETLKITLAIVIGCIAFLCIIIIILNLMKLELKYFAKKHFTNFEISAQKVTYLVYSDDAFRGQQKNPLKDITSWLIANNRNYYDPNSPDSYTDIGQPVAQKSREAVDKCLSMTVILTPNLLNDNTVEIVRSYRAGFEDNVTRDFPVIFLCSKAMKKEIFQKAANFNELKQNLFVTFVHFMKRNTVIYWKPDNLTKLHRSLYVALPKVKSQE